MSDQTVVAESPRDQLPHAAAWPTGATIIAWTVIACGAAVRLRQFLAGRSLWMDEVFLSMNVIERNWLELTNKLANHQGAPLGYLWLLRGLVRLLGPQDWVLRLPAIVAGVAALPLLYFVARRILAWQAGLVALALFAVLRPAIYYSAEVKQYGPDTAIALGLLLAGLRCYERPESFGRLALLAVLGTAAIFMSHPAIFVLAGVGLVLLGVQWVDSRRCGLIAISAVGALWVYVFLWQYLLLLRPLLRDPFLTAYWDNEGAFMPIGLSTAGWLWERLQTYAGSFMTMDLQFPQVALVMVLVGSVMLWRRDRAAMLMLVAPLVVGCVASARGSYPMDGRLFLWALPAFLAMIGAAAEALWFAARPGFRFVPILLVALVILPEARKAAGNLRRPQLRHELKPVLSELSRRIQPGDRVFVYYNAWPAYGFYRDRYGLGTAPCAVSSEIHRTATDPSLDDWSAVFRDAEGLKGAGRVWVVFSHVYRGEGSAVDEQKLVMMALDQAGQRIDDSRIIEPGAAAFLYQMR